MTHLAHTSARNNTHTQEGGGEFTQRIAYQADLELLKTTSEIAVLATHLIMVTPDAETRSHVTRDLALAQIQFAQAILRHLEAHFARALR